MKTWLIWGGIFALLMILLKVWDPLAKYRTAQGNI